MKAILIGGNFGDTPKESSIITKLYSKFESATKINGGTIQDLIDINLKGFDLIIWMPNIENEIPKHYPKKDIGSVLICSKVLREDGNIGDAVSRIFKMRANAVISIDSQNKPFSFKLIDALANLWSETSDVTILYESIIDLYKWSKASIRASSFQLSFMIPGKYDNTDFCEIIKKVADKVENERGGRYFGNASTRCSKMFPSSRFNKSNILVSARNISKERISSEDFVETFLDDNVVYYNSMNELAKPSVDTPIQLRVYQSFPNINYMIHGHAYIKDAKFTSHYYPCGDLREYEEINKLFKNKVFIINLKNHGFLIATNTLLEMSNIVNSSNFIFKPICEDL